MEKNEEKYIKLSQEFDEFRMMSAELEEQLELDLKERQETISILESECSVLRSKRQQEIKTNNNMIDKMQQSEQLLKNKLDSTKGKLRVLEVDEETREKELRRVNNALVHSKQALEDLQEEHVLLQGELSHSESERISAKRSCEQLQRQLKESSLTSGNQQSAKITVSGRDASLLLGTLSDSRKIEIDLLKFEASVQKHLKLKLWERRRST